MTRVNMLLDEARVLATRCLLANGCDAANAEAIADSGLAVSVHSAALLACVANGRPAVAVVPPALRRTTENIVMIELERAGLLVEDAGALRALVEHLRAGADASAPIRDLARDWSPCLDGGAARRIADRVCARLDAPARTPDVVPA